MERKSIPAFWGHWTYKIFANYWLHQVDNPIGKAFNKATKYVVTRGPDRLDWEKSLRIDGDVVEEIRRLDFGSRSARR